MEDTLYAKKLAEEAEIWSFNAEQQASLVPPDWQYHRDLRHNAIMQTAHIEELLSHVQSGSNVLELGCGSGWLTLAMAQRGARARGLDISEKALDIARSYYESARENIAGSATYEVADLNTISLPTEYYDVIVAKGVLHHLLNPVNLIDQIHRALKPDGLLWVSDINGDETMLVVLIASVLTFVLPTQVTYRDKIYGLFRFGVHAPEHIKASMQGNGASPFEGVGRQWDWFKMINERFVIKRCIDYPAFTGYVAAEVKMPDCLALPLLRTMYKLDCALVRHNILHSTGFMLYAHKYSHPQQGV